MYGGKSCTLHELKSAAMNSGQYTDAQILVMFANVKVRREEEIGEACGILGNYRPALAKKIAAIMKDAYLKERLTKNPQPDPPSPA